MFVDRASAAPPDYDPNELIATGALWAMLDPLNVGLPRSLNIVLPGYGDNEGLAPNQLRVQFEFLKSSYLVTVTREPDDDVSETA